MKQEPLVPAHVDLTGYEFMPLYGHKLLSSDFNSRVSDAGFRAGLMLWWEAWNQVPAASLPDDDVVLTGLAGLGRGPRAVKEFQQIKAEALHGFVLCDDGRLYHKKLAVWALEAWDRRVKERERKARWRRDKGGDGDVPETGTSGGTKTPPNTGQALGQDTGRDRRVPLEVKGSRSEVEVKRTSKPEVGVTPTDSAPATGCQTGLKKQGNSKANGGFNTVAESWRKTPLGIAATGRTFGVERRQGESDADFEDRVACAVDAKRRSDEADAARREQVATR